MGNGQERPPLHFKSIEEYNGAVDKANTVEEIEALQGDVMIDPPAGSDDVVPAAAAVAAEGATTPAPAAVATVPAPVAGDGDEEVTFQFKKKDIGTYGSSGELLKALKEKEALIERQSSFIKDRFNPTQGPSETEKQATARIADLEKELNELRSKSTVAPTAGTPAAAAAASTEADIVAAKAEIDRIAQQEEELDQLEVKNVDLLVDQDHLEKRRALRRASTKWQSTVVELLQKRTAQITDIESLRKDITERSKAEQLKREEEEQKRTHEAYRQRLFQEVDNSPFADLKLSRPAADVEKDYLKWEKDAVAAVLQRPPANGQEYAAALNSLMQKTPQAITACQLVNVNPEPTDDFKKYAEWRENSWFMDGMRKDGMGMWKPLPNGQGKFSTLKEATIARRAAEGYYEKAQALDAQRNAASYAAAATRRDIGATELAGKGAEGFTAKDESSILAEIDKIDETKMMHEARAGNTKKLDKYNELMKLIDPEHEPIVV